MQIVLSDQSEHLVIDKSVNALEKGGIVVYPSDTVYGIAVDATSQEAVAKLDKLKNRRADLKYSYNFADIEMIEQYHDLEDYQKEILKKYLPGSFTFILSPNFSVRIVKDNIITKITKAFGKPTTGTSANISGKAPATSIKNLDAKIYLAADILIEKPDFEFHKPSTLVDISTKDFKILREGDLPFKG